MKGYWDQFLREERCKPYFLSLMEFLRDENEKYEVYPPSGDIFRAFQLTPFEKTKVIILGQDPYHEKGEAMGLSFSVREGTPIPPSLLNIKKELENEGYSLSSSDLTPWAEQGVLLLNTTMTVRAHEALSHQARGWETFTDEAIKRLNADNSPKVFLLWGSSARRKKELITNPIHLILESAHPSPLSAYRGFLGNNHFSLANSYLIEHGLEPINW